MRSEGRRLVEVLALAGIAVTQPVLDVFGASTETFVFRGVDRTGLVAFALGVSLLPALALWTGGLVLGVAGPRARGAAHLVTLGGLAALAVVVACTLTGGPRGAAALALAVGVGVGGAVAYRRWAPVRTLAGWLVIVPLVAVASFLFVSPASSLVTGGDVEVTDEVAAETPVVMLVLDEFPTAALLDADGGIDRERFPNFAALAEESRWYRNYTTVNASTTKAVPSILTGRVPQRGDQPVYGDIGPSLFTLLGGTYGMRVTETVTGLCPPSVCDGEDTLTRTVGDGRAGLSGLAADAGDVLSDLAVLEGSPEVAVDAFTEEVVVTPEVADGDGDPDAHAVQPVRFTDFLTGLEAVDEPTLDFLHLILPHGPWRLFADGTRYESPEVDPQGLILGVWEAAWPADLGRLRLDLQTRYTDALVGEMVERLQATDLWDEAVIVVVSDHGGSLIAGERGRAVTATNTHEVMWTPLFVRAPGLGTGVTDANVQSVDVLPTVADLLGVDVPFAVDGASVLAAPDDPEGDEAEKRYDRFNNPFQPGPDRVLTIDGEAGLARLLAEAPAGPPSRDPIGSFYRATEVGGWYGRPVAGLDVGPPARVEANIDRLDDLEGGVGPGEPLPAYVRGELTAAVVPDDAWVVIALDGEVAAVSRVFTDPGVDQAFGALLDPAVLADPTEGAEVALYLTTDDGGPLRPVRLDR